MFGMRSYLFVLWIIGSSSAVYADHPNEGKVAIMQLVEEAQKNNLEIQRSEENLRALKLKHLSQFGRFVPRLSVEGGPQSTKYDDGKSSGTAIYGKAEWNLYNGGTDRSSIELSKIELESEERLLKALRNRVRSEISKIYYELQFLLESISLKQKAIELNAQQMKIAKAKNVSGFTTSLDVLEFDLRESTLQSDLVLLNQQLSQKSRDLDVLLSRQSQSNTEAVRGHLVRENIEFNRTELLAKIQESNDQLLLARIEFQQAQTEKQQAKSQFLPRLDLEAKYGRLATDEKIFNDNDNYAVMLKFKLPLFSGFEDVNTVQSLNAKVGASQKTIDQKNISLVAELDSVLAEVSALKARLDLEEKNLERSEKYYKMTLEEYRRGIKNSPDMVGASERLLDARIRNLEYRRDLMLAKAKIQELTGE